MTFVQDRNLLRVLLIRHGQTEWNRVERFRGMVDLNLNQTGYKQAELLAQRIKTDKFNPQFILTSPLKRAFQTAKTISDINNIPVRIGENLIDINYGDWQGLSPEEAKIHYPQLYTLWLTEPQAVRFPSGEGLYDVYQRIKSLIETLSTGADRSTIILVSHKVVCKVLMCYFTGLELNSFWQVEQDVCALNIVEIDGSRFRVTLVNDTCHLKHMEIKS